MTIGHSGIRLRYTSDDICRVGPVPSVIGVLVGNRHDSLSLIGLIRRDNLKGIVEIIRSVSIQVNGTAVRCRVNEDFRAVVHRDHTDVVALGTGADRQDQSEKQGK